MEQVPTPLQMETNFTLVRTPLPELTVIMDTRLPIDFLIFSVIIAKKHRNRY